MCKRMWLQTESGQRQPITERQSSYYAQYVSNPKFLIYSHISRVGAVDSGSRTPMYSASLILEFPEVARSIISFYSTSITLSAISPFIGCAALISFSEISTRTYEELAACRRGLRGATRSFPQHAPRFFLLVGHRSWLTAPRYYTVREISSWVSMPPVSNVLHGVSLSDSQGKTLYDRSRPNGFFDLDGLPQRLICPRSIELGQFFS